MKINIASPQIGKEEIKAVTEVMKTGMLAQGKKVAEFEDKFAKVIGTKFAVATSNGTTGLEIVLRAYSIGQGDEVITTPFTFIASANAILYTGARPVFCDIDETTFQIDANKIEKLITKKTKAILPVHLFGAAADMTKIMSLGRKHKLQVIEDACQAHGVTWKNKKVGSFTTGVFSLYATKNMTTGEGGMITTDSKEIYEKAKLLRDHGSPKKYHHDILGYNYRMTDIEAAIGLEQLKKLNKFNVARIKNAKYLTKYLSKIPGIITPSAYPESNHIYHLYTIRLTKDFPLSRDELMAKLTEAGIGSAINYPMPIEEQKLYRDLGYKVTTPIAAKVCQEVLSLPIHPGLKQKDLEYIIKIFQKIIENFK